jgi:hypothetical protein
MTTATRPAEPAVSRVLGTFAWLSQAGMATTYAAVLVQPDAWHTMYATDSFQTVLLWCYAGGMALVWAGSLWQEQRSFYHRDVRTVYRKSGLLGHISILLVSLVAAIALPGRVALWSILPVMSLFVIAVWTVWMHSLSLPPEDQAVVDAITARQAAQSASLREAAAQEFRRTRLNGIVSKLGYEITDPATKDDAGPVVWQIPPRKHAPLVYFIRNGNRVKIGTSTEVRRRIRTLALRAENVVLLLDGGKPLEREHHDRFADLRIGNTEWFAYEGALVDYIQTETARLTREDQDQ